MLASKKQKIQYWRASSGIYALKTALVLEFAILGSAPGLTALLFFLLQFLGFFLFLGRFGGFFFNEFFCVFAFAHGVAPW